LFHFFHFCFISFHFRFIFVTFFYLFFIFFFSFSTGFKGLGRMGPALVITSASTILTLLLDPLLMFGWGPVPALGVAGAAVSAGISAVIISVFSLFGLVKVGVRLRWHRPAVDVVKRLLEVRKEKK
jgi:Na+-driven multidrug efflux pump